MANAILMFDQLTMIYWFTFTMASLYSALCHLWPVSGLWKVLKSF